MKEPIVIRITNYIRAKLVKIEFFFTGKRYLKEIEITMELESPDFLHI